MPGKMLDTLARLDRFGRAVETALLAIILGGLMLVGIGQIILREFFSFGFIWANELQNFMVLWLAMIAAVAACRDNRHIRIDALSHVLPDAFIRFSRVFVDLFAAAVCLAIAWQVWRYIQLEIEFEDTVLLDTPAWIVHGIVPLAFLLTGYRFIVGAIRKAAGLETEGERGELP